ncbi:aminoacyl-tRNA hydrolase [bacterium endosymbiont of Pedicinus badii]|uniref:aminoacyl-tRNA hydrolase n=1 Tax=bacterium endosymbiont of Pedicinus badii TaxID=1719126 RepID=UPI0009D4E564|nr:aminoacyl-tRNA hydrolase [bacterium endosymbiont of Pedicinus badii]OQM34379.1 hypothetical protein AOQ89_00605 [bacterium endosymbiont of Pedicinus badii]
MIKLLVGLSNPGKKYESTRHNIGKIYLKELAKHKKKVFSRKKYFFGYLTSFIEKKKINLLVPDLFMNLNGISVEKVKNFYKFSNKEIAIVHDEIDLPIGKIKICFGKYHNGHNGVKNIIEILKNKDFYRIKIGIGRPKNKTDISDFVLKNFSEKEKKIIKNCIKISIKSKQYLIYN